MSEAQVLVELMNPAVKASLVEYTKWYLLSSILWSLLGILLMVPALFWKKIPNPEGHGDFDFRWLVLGITVVGGIIVLANLPDIIHPEARAIHEFISDVRGSR